MKSLKTAAIAAFAALPYTREQREAKFHENTLAMRDAIKEICQHHLASLTKELKDFDEDNWLVGDECGNALLIMKDLSSPYMTAEFGSQEVALKESGEIWIRIHLDNVFSDGFESIFLKTKNHALIELLIDMVKDLIEEYGLSGLGLYFKGEEILPH